MGIEEQVSQGHRATDSQEVKMSLSVALRPIIEDFLRAIDYTTPPKKDIEALKAAMFDFAGASGIEYEDPKHAHRLVLAASNVASDMYPSHPLPIQLHIGKFSWVGFLIDDTSARDPSAAQDMALFQSRFLAGQPQPTRLLQCFAETIQEMYQYWDPLVANFMAMSALAFVTANALERRPEYQQMQPSPSAPHWAYHFRNIEGLPEVYTYYMFPQAEYPDLAVFLQAVPDLCRFINWTNDVLSFYKEEIAGETKNYIHSRARYEKKLPVATMRDVVVDCADSYLRANEVLAGHEKYEKVWLEYVHGYVAMHIKTKRYLMADLGLLP